MQYHEKTVFHWCHLQKIPEHIPFHKWDQDDHRCQNTVEQDRKGVVSSLHRLFGDHAVNTIAKSRANSQKHSPQIPDATALQHSADQNTSRDRKCCAPDLFQCDPFMKQNCRHDHNKNRRQAQKHRRQ